MALLLKTMYTSVMDLNELQDPRTYGNIFVASPFNLLLVMGVYAYFFKKLGPQLMENRKPFDIKNAMMVYNCLQILFNSYVFVKSSMNMWGMKTPLCESVDYSDSPQALEIVRITRLYMYLKFFDFVDTLFFLLRKSYRQISFLHLYHHCAMMLLVWIGYKFYGGGGSGHWVVTINSFVHIVMFVYYLLTSIDEKWKNSFTFKRTLTQIQLVQFLFFLIVFSRIAMFQECTLNRPLAALFAVQNVFMLLLFGDFYVRSYMKPKKLK